MSLEPLNLLTTAVPLYSIPTRTYQQFPPVLHNAIDQKRNLMHRLRLRGNTKAEDVRNPHLRLRQRMTILGHDENLHWGQLQWFKNARPFVWSPFSSHPIGHQWRTLSGGQDMTGNVQETMPKNEKKNKNGIRRPPEGSLLKRKCNMINEIIKNQNWSDFLLISYPPAQSSCCLFRSA